MHIAKCEARCCGKAEHMANCAEEELVKQVLQDLLQTCSCRGKKKNNPQTKKQTKHRQCVKLVIGALPPAPT